MIKITASDDVILVYRMYDAKMEYREVKERDPFLVRDAIRSFTIDVPHDLLVAAATISCNSDFLYGVLDSRQFMYKKEVHDRTVIGDGITGKTYTGSTDGNNVLSRPIEIMFDGDGISLFAGGHDVACEDKTIVFGVGVSADVLMETIRASLSAVHDIPDRIASLAADQVANWALQREGVESATLNFVGDEAHMDVRRVRSRVIDYDSIYRP